ncbi:MAG: DUF4346 domain-containing protein, partial [Candidatus Woesearchaeota archaeon]|nr:DUF4346 domain-containing protein [Candidatus Woesearchaeota archaeon]
VAKKISKKEYAIIGQLYNAERGIDMLIRTLLANPQIKLVVVTGNDLSKSGQVLIDFFKKGFEEGITKSTQRECWKIVSAYEGYIGKDIPKEDLESLKESILCTRIEDITKLDKTILDLPNVKRVEKVYEKVVDDFSTYVTSERGFVFHHKTVVEAWLSLLDKLLKYGSAYQDLNESNINELQNVTIVLTKENPNKLFIPDAFPYGKDHILAYTKEFTTQNKKEGVGYRLRTAFGFDQLKQCVQDLEKNGEAMLAIWDPRQDKGSIGSPALNHIWVGLRNQQIKMTVHYRTLDMFSGFPQDAMALICLQEVIRKDLIRGSSKKKVGLGPLVIQTTVAYIDQQVEEACKDIIEKYYADYIETEPSKLYDPRGNFVISLVDKKIQLQFTTATGEHLKTFTGVQAYQLRRQVLREGIVSSPEHGVYFGLELMKAEMALKQNKPYVQDQPLR